MNKLTQSDFKEVNLFRRFLLCKKKYGMKAILRRKYWKIYLGLETE